MNKVHVVAHTHWDREWYRPFQYFRTKLVFVIDTILDTLEKDDEFRFFLLDGQSIVLDDYLEVKPEARERLKNLISKGRLIVGPWYIQPDEFAPDGESLIRNLLLGISSAENFGKSMRVGYLPDSFGQSAQMPQILRGFDISSAVMMRGVPAYSLEQTEFRWQGLNGDEVLSVYLPKGYSNAMFLPDSPLKAVARLKEVVGKLKKWSKNGHILVMNGVDHQFIQPSLPESVKAINKVSLNTTYEISSIEQYVGDVAQDAKDLPILKNELLSPDRNRVHSSIASTRIYQKQKNRKMQALLERYVEPIATMAWLNGADYPKDLIWQAWKYLLQNQTHDGICGCCTDGVHQEMDFRFSNVEEIGTTLLKSYSRAIARRINAEKTLLTVFNNSMVKGNQIVKATVFSKTEDIELVDMNGENIDFVVDVIEEIDAAEMTIWTLYLETPEPYKKIDISFRVNFDFNVGYRLFEILEGKKPQKEITLKSATNAGCETDDYVLKFKTNGTFDLFDKALEKDFKGCHLFEDCGDAGDTYNYSPVANDTVVTSADAKAKIQLVNVNALKFEYLINLVMQVPETLIENDTKRSTNLIELPIQTRLTVYRNEKRIEFATEIENYADYHRVRVLFPVGFLAETSFAETQFGVVERDVKLNVDDWQEKKFTEKPLPIYFMHKFVCLQNEEYGLAVLNRGLPEYEIYSDGEQSSIAITLLRGVGMLGKSDLLIRPGRPSGIVVPTPDAQCHGKQVLQYALYPFNGRLDEVAISNEALKFENQNLAVQNCIQMPTLEKKFALMLGMASMETITSHVTDSLENIQEKDQIYFLINSPHLIISALKKAELDNGMILRLYNETSKDVSGVKLSVPDGVVNCTVTNFYEDELENLTINDHEVILPTVKRYSAVTLKLKK